MKSRGGANLAAAAAVVSLTLELTPLTGDVQTLRSEENQREEGPWRPEKQPSMADVFWSFWEGDKVR